MEVEVMEVEIVFGSIACKDFQTRQDLKFMYVTTLQELVNGIK